MGREQTEKCLEEYKGQQERKGRAVEVMTLTVVM